MGENVIRVVIEGGAGGSRGGGSTTPPVNEVKTIFDLQKQLRQEVKNTASATGDWSAETVKAKQKLEEVNKKVRELNNLGKENKNTWGAALSSYQFKFNALGNIVANVTSAMVQMGKELVKSVIKISKDFEFAMGGVRAITQATDKEFVALRNDAIRLGGATLFTAKAVAELQTELAKLGFSVREIRAATDGVVALAQATGEDLGQSALVAGTIIRGFNLDAGELTRVVDVMAQSFNASALDLYKFAETMKYVAPVASKTGFTMEEVTAMMAKLADQGVIASQAGTSLRNLLLRLADANSKLSKSIGFTVTSLPELVLGLKDLAKAGLDSTKALQLSDRYSVTALLALSQQADGIWDLYRSMTETAGAAEEMSRVRMDNFTGSVEKLSGAWDSFVLSINESNGALKAVVDGVAWAIEGITEALKGTGQRAGELANELMNSYDRVQQKVIIDIAQRKNAEIEAIMDSVMATKTKVQLIKEINAKFDGEQRGRLKQTAQFEMQSALSAVSEYQAEVAKLMDKRIRWFTWTEGDVRDLKEATKQLSAFSQHIESLYQKTAEAKAKMLQDLADAYEDASEKEQERLDRINQLRIDAMVEGLEKELEEVNVYYRKRIRDAEDMGVVDIDFTRAWNEAKLRVIKEFNDKQLKEYKKGRDALIKISPKKYMGEILQIDEKKWDSIADENFEKLQKAFAKKMGSGMMPSTMQTVSENWSKIIVGTLKDGTEIAKYELKADFGKSEDDWNVFSSIIGGGLTSEQRSALKQGINFITDELQRLADKEVEIADRRVENAERVVEQLQRDIEIEIQLKEKGFANNLSLRQRELDEAKSFQQQALVAQEQAAKKQRDIEAIIQAANLFTTGTEIVKAFTKKEPTIGWLIGLGVAATMVGGYMLWKNNTQSKLNDTNKFAEGGEITGAKHSGGGVNINAEGGEYVVKASAYSKHADLVQAINSDNLSQIYGVLNKDLSVSLDDTKTAKMMGKYFGNSRRTYHNGYYVEQSGNRRRTIRYA